MRNNRNMQGYGGQNNGGFRREGGRDGFTRNTPKQEWDSAGYQKSWISNSIDSSFPEFAEKIGKYMADNKLTNSKIRSIYGEMKRIQMGDYDKEKASFYLLRPKVAYALGRDRENKGLELFKIMFDECSKDVVDKRTFLNFCNVFEAVLAYHRAHGGKD